ncbi:MULTISPECIES: aminopeptidase N [Marinobacter]|jgi:aminopeptidase N|uniref:aminopeptidase N n=1 Tax=Marinobacter TaxID=2742 RepID=UPI000F857A29|nr:MULTISPECIES: aminopeptidase N [Marinobacter]AZR39831.1 membrane alanyl aminopeptidase [Marinobacter salarius]MCZ4284524.1 aminopeptidase N [Marinobacter salarius]MDC8454849.1 aminopeptidase N [Marinobacter sp. DS40M6]MDM8181591.1 aminopeptidase N [Marinobacter salarius]RUT74107.1 aminopeptidase N [Marinobacter sp. NP-6]
MRTSQPQTIFLKDYRVPAFLVDHVDLRFELFEDGARVHCTLAMRRNPDSDSSDKSLELDGDSLTTLESVSLDGNPLEGSAYEDRDDKLTLHEVPDQFNLGVVTWIEPQNNTRLEGLYKSSGMFCTQCEAEGFRCITYFPDRPDVMARFRTRVEAGKTRYPILLSNGNDVEKGDLADGRHFVTWEDPFPKPCYLFALVAGDLLEKRDTFKTMSGRDIDLRMYVEPRNAEKCDHAMDSLKRAMRWDEEVYGREYDLDIFMIVAVDDFNMGAMENKGLNIFNSSCVLASQETATDMAFQRIESIVAHEYFHNWSGNRVTCRDWFQLSLKEGFTVFRDSCFSADVGSPTVKRIEDATMLRTAQFAEDAGPMAHPVRPESYMEITNFYTLTIYEKGSEVVGMIHTLLGPDLFRKGSDLYFERHDGQAVTTDDFVRAMEDASGRDLSQFRLWYEQSGTPELTVRDEFDDAAGIYRLTIKQSIPDTPGQTDKKPQHIPFAIGLLGAEGESLPLKLAADDADAPTDRVLELTDASHTFEFHGLSERPVPSLLRGFSAPVRVFYPWTREQLTFLMSHDSDGFNRWDAGQRLAVDVINSLVSSTDGNVDAGLVEAYRSLLADSSLDQALVAKMLQLPSEAYLIELADQPNVPAIHRARERVLAHLARSLRDELLACYHRNTLSGHYEVTPEAVARRSLRNTALAWLLHIDDEEGRTLATSQFNEADNMTDRMGALRALVNSGYEKEQEQALADFYQQWKDDPQVVEQWFAVQSGSTRTGGLRKVHELMEHPAFDWKNPNKIRSVIGVFAGQNLPAFHAEDGAGYQFLAEQVRKLDDSNPQIAARLVSPLTRWRKFAPVHGEQMKSALETVRDKSGLSRDVYEVVHKSLAGQ